MMKKLLYFLLGFLPILFNAQFTQTVTTTPEFCIGDGKINISISNTTVGAEFEFIIYLLPNTATPYRVVNGVAASATNFIHEELNFPAGNYTLVTNEVIGTTNTQQTSSFSITNNFKGLIFTNSVAYSCGLGIVTVNVSQGSPATYELRNSSGTVRPPQTSNVFSNVPPGTYNVVVADTCGNSKGLSVTINSETNNYAFVWADTNISGFNFLKTCNTIKHQIVIRRNGTTLNSSPDKFPITVKYTVTGPGGTPITEVTRIFANNAELTNASLNTIELPYYYNQAFTIKGEITDACGNYYTNTKNITAGTIGMTLTQEPSTCGLQFLRVSRLYRTAPPFTMTFLEYPSGFQPSNYNSNFGAGSYSAIFPAGLNIDGYIDFGSNTMPVPNGTYKIRVTDDCGHTIERTIVINAGLALTERIKKPGCGLDYGGVQFFITSTSNLSIQVGNITSFKILNGPATFSSSYPVTMNSAIEAGGTAIINLPVGTYTIEAENTCGSTIQRTYTVVGETHTYSPTVVYNCGSFNYQFDLVSNSDNATIQLERYDTATSTWVAVSSYNPAGSGSTFTGAINNITQTGNFRAILSYGGTSIGAFTTCSEVVHEFNVTPGGLSLNNYYVVACADNTYNLILDVTGIPPLTYEIIEKNGVAVSINNGSSPVFANLASGIYKVRISDNCGNAIIVNVRVNQNKLPIIRASNLCNGENGKLFITGLSFLDIEWSKNGTVISPSAPGNNTVNFTPYNSATHTGLYSARLTYNPNPNACIDNVVTFNLTTANENNANAGTGQTVTIYKDQITGPINLFDYITGPYDNYGEFIETTNSGLLLDNEWFGEFASNGSYTFDYTVKGTCSGSDTTTITINLIGGCYKPSTATGDALDSKFGITSLGRAGAEAQNDNWPMARKGAHMVLESKTKGFVINRMESPETTIPSSDWVDGMMVYDIDDECLKIYVKDDNNAANSGWKCFKTQTCN